MDDRTLIHAMRGLLATAVDAAESSPVTVRRGRVWFRKILVTQAWVDEAKKLEVKSTMGSETK